jgi:hypothetical protein
MRQVSDVLSNAEVEAAKYWTMRMGRKHLWKRNTTGLLWRHIRDFEGLEPRRLSKPQLHPFLVSIYKLE